MECYYVDYVLSFFLDVTACGTGRNLCTNLGNTSKDTYLKKGWHLNKLCNSKPLRLQQLLKEESNLSVRWEANSGPDHLWLLMNLSTVKFYKVYFKVICQYYLSFCVLSACLRFSSSFKWKYFSEVTTRFWKPDVYVSKSSLTDWILSFSHIRCLQDHTWGTTILNLCIVLPYASN